MVKNITLKDNIDFIPPEVNTHELGFFSFSILLRTLCIFCFVTTCVLPHFFCQSFKFLPSFLLSVYIEGLCLCLILQTIFKLLLDALTFLSFWTLANPRCSFLPSLYLDRSSFHLCCRPFSSFSLANSWIFFVIFPSSYATFIIYLSIYLSIFQTVSNTFWRILGFFPSFVLIPHLSACIFRQFSTFCLEMMNLQRDSTRSSIMIQMLKLPVGMNITNGLWSMLHLLRPQKW